MARFARNSVQNFLILIIVFCSQSVWSQYTNRAPHFIPVVGDMSKFSLKENTPVGTPIYQLKGMDPESSQIHYSISGQHFDVDRSSGVVTLKQPLDRESQDLIEVIISITDEGIANSEPNTVSLRREIAILDENDNAPIFLNRPYRANISENSPVNSVVVTTTHIIVTDRDEGVNADVTITCHEDTGMQTDDDVCDTFSIYTEKIDEGTFQAHISLAKTLDFEQRSAYVLTLKATDGGSKPLTALANVAIEVLDVQDQIPIFINAPYSATVSENTPQGTSILKIKAKDGDTGNPRPVLLTIEDDKLEYFDLVTEKGSGEAILVTTKNLLDREHPDVLQNGGIYILTVKATELINNELPSEFSTTQITIVITDVDDQIPTFNQDHYEINLSEDISNGTSIPGLNMVVVDNDMGANSRYNLSLRHLGSASGIFEVVPKHGEGRTPVVIKVMDNSQLDYDVADVSKRTLQFEVIARVKDIPVAKAKVTIHLLDANDNAPMFNATQYRVHVQENSPKGLKIADIKAYDLDSGKFGKVYYYLRGFGEEKFRTMEVDGGLYVEKSLDYEQQKSYSLTLEAVDGGGKINSVSVFVDVDDINDNSPMFESREYLRTIREGATSFEPQLFVHATDVDGPNQGGGKIYYSIVSTNSISENLNGSKIFSIIADTGEIKIERPVHSMDTPRGQYDLIVRATDAGVPSLHNETRVLIRVGIPGNQRPIFKGNYSPLNIHLLPGSGLMHYKASVKETAEPNTNVTIVQAMDPDGQDSLLNYYIAGGHKDNFIIDQKSGVISTSPYVNLDLDSNPKSYDIIVHAIDNGLPVHETATSTVFITVEDINNKAPMFNVTNSTAHVSERAENGTFVMKINAFDPDESAKLEYKLIEPIRAKDKTGTAVKSSLMYDYKNAFGIKQDGTIYVKNKLSYNSAAVIFVTVQVKDLNAVIAPENQIAKTEVTIYIQAYSDNNPFFLIGTDKPEKESSGIQTRFYDAATQTAHIKVHEELPIGFKILMLQAKDPNTDTMISTFKLMHSSTDLFTVLQNGEVIVTKRVDFEVLDDKILNLVVKAIADDMVRSSEIRIFIEVLDVNDNAPEFEQKSYRTSIQESARFPERLLTIKAHDLDAPSLPVLHNQNTPDLIQKGYGDVMFSLSGENSNYFVINSTTGVIQVSPNTTLDRERQSVLRFNVIAMDAPSAPTESLKATAQVVVDVLDVNDNAPKFTMKSFTAVAAENVQIGTSVVNMTATDPDEGLGGEITYEILDESEVNGLFQMNIKSGEILTRSALTGKGRTEPYLLSIRAQDGGGLFTDVHLTLYIGDISANDGVPTIIKPSLEQIAYVSENSTIGSPVFQVVATDPDDPAQPSGKLTYRLLKDGVDYQAFNIDFNTGLITTKALLDREKKDLYTLALVVQDRGEPPQQATRILTVQVTDIDDHKPRFVRGVDDTPIKMSIVEEVPFNTTIGEISALDEDIGENAAIDYIITSGNEHHWFWLDVVNDSIAVIKTAKRIDREEQDHFTLTIKCFKASEKKNQITRKPYNRLDPSEIQVLITVIDIDDSLPKFAKDNITIGVRLNVPIDTSLLSFQAVDIDANALPIKYHILNSSFTPLVDFGDQLNATNVFRIDENSGDLRTAKSLVNYVDGVFTLAIRANNSIIDEHHINTTLQVYIVRDRDMLKFVFRKPPAEVRKILTEFENAVQEALDQPQLKLHVYDTQFHSKWDNSLDFSSTSSCFQLIGPDALSTSQMMGILQNEMHKDKLTAVYDQFKVANVERCSLRSIVKAETTMVQLWVLIIASFIGFAAIISSCTLCCLHRKYKTATKQSLIRESSQVAPSVSYVTTMSGPRMYAEPIYAT